MEDTTSDSSLGANAPMGHSKKPFNTKLVLILAGAAALVATGIWAAIYPGLTVPNTLPESTMPSTEFSAKKPQSDDKSVDPTANWQIYQNEKHGFMLKYPNDWFSRQCGDSYVGFSYDKNKLPACFTNQDQPHVNIKISGAETDFSEYVQGAENSIDNTLRETVEIGGISAVKITGLTKMEKAPGPPPGVNAAGVMFSHKNNVYDFYYFGLDNKNYSKIFDQILSTFKFTDSAAATTDSVKIFLIAPDDNGVIGEKVGCGDSVVSVARTIEPTSGPLKAALDELFYLKDKDYGQSGLYNALYQSKISVDSVNIVNGKAEVRLSGSIISGGACDSPRIQAQIEETIKQFPTVKTFAIFLNGSEENYKKLFSGR